MNRQCVNNIWKITVSILKEIEYNYKINNNKIGSIIIIKIIIK